MKKIKCEVCGNKFPIGNSPITGLPNGVGLTFEDVKGIFNVCSVCIAFRNDQVLKKADEFIADNHI